MPILKVYGERATITGDRQVTQLPSSKAASPPIQTNRFFRNSKHPDASAMNQLCDQTNQAMVFRTKEAFSILGDLGSPPGIQATSTAGTRPRWRFVAHTSPMTHLWLARVVMFPPSSNYGTDTYSTLRLYDDAAESNLVGTWEFHYGPGPAGSTSVGGWQYHRVIDRYIDGLSPDTTYYGLISDVDFGRAQSMAIADLQSMTEGFDGYLPTSFTEQSQVLDIHRENLVSAMPAMWRRGGAKVLNFTVNIQSSPVTIASATATNILDSSSTTYGSSIPGYSLDMTGKARLSQGSTGVPIIMYAYMKCTSASNGVVELRNSSGLVVATCTNTYGAGVAGWISATGFLPATTQKVYLTHSTAAGTLSTYAVSIFEYET